MKTLVPLDTACPNDGSNPFTPPTPTGDFTITQNVPANALTVEVDLSSYGFSNSPRNILPALLAATENEPNIALYGLQWSATSFSANLSAPTPDEKYILKLQIFP